MSASNEEKLLLYINAESNLLKYFNETGRFHVDCNCSDCKAIEKWMELSWWKRLIAKLNL